MKSKMPFLVKKKRHDILDIIPHLSDNHICRTWHLASMYCFNRLPGFTGPIPSATLDKDDIIILSKHVKSTT